MDPTIIGRLSSATGLQQRFGHEASVWEVLAFQVDLASALAVARLMRPQLREVRGCVVIDAKVSESTVDHWWHELKGDRARIEGVLSHIHLADVLPVSIDSEEDWHALCEFAELVGACWRETLRSTYENRRFTVVVDLEDDNGPTVAFFST